MSQKALETYRTNKQHVQDELAVQYLPAVRAMSYRLKERLPSSIEVSDLVSIGTEELVKLARRYDSAVNDSFWGYAKTRVYGSMLDYLRQLDTLSRSNRKLVKKIDSEIVSYLNKYEEEPTDEYLSETIGETIEKIREARIANEIYSVMPITDQMSIFGDSDTEYTIEIDSLKEAIEKVLVKLPEREQMIIQLYYYEELSLKEISEVLEITESRISQIHKQVVAKLRLELERE